MGLPAVAAVGVTADDALFSRTLVRLPEADADAAAADAQPTDPAPPSSGSDGLLVLLVALVLLGLSGLAFLLVARRRARRVMASDVRPPVPDGVIHPGRVTTAGQPPLAALSQAGAAPDPPTSSTEQWRPPATHPPQSAIALSGDGDAVVALATKISRPAVVHIVGNADAHFFGIRTVGTDSEVVNTIELYDGTRPLDWDGRESTGFDVRATGPWTITVLPVAEAPSFDTSFAGQGDMVVRFTGDGSVAEITGNDQGRYFSVRALGAHATVGLVNTTEAYSGASPIGRGPQTFAIEATGSWTLSVT